MRIDNKFGNKGLKYELIKTILMYEIINKNKKNKYWINLYSELEYEYNQIVSVYYLNSKTTEDIVYMIEDKPSKYKFSGNEALVRIDINKISNDLNKMREQIKELI